ncbi:transcriptional regulator [Opitutaceae bacterium TAV1]|nr:transcriptional regulator [Opitutaceae bacterium TAV1]
MNTPKRATQREVARKAGVTQATVSMALHNHPDLAPATCARIQRIAAELGYAPDPFLAGLSAYRKQLRPVKYQATLAWLTNDEPGSGWTWSMSAAFRGYYEGANRRAAELGYQFEEHRLQAPDMTPARLEQVLKARGVAGLLLAPQPHPGVRLDDFPFASFSAVTFGYTLVSPQLHLVTLHPFRSMELMMRRLLAMGYHRPGLALGTESDERADNNWSAGFWSEQRRMPKKDCVRMYAERIRALERGPFLKWFYHYRPDVVLTMGPHVCEWLAEDGVRVPEDTGVALLTVPDGGKYYSGIWENPHLIGARAVELLIDMIHRNERGVPDVPQCVLIAGTWVEGKTVRRKK